MAVGTILAIVGCSEVDGPYCVSVSNNKVHASVAFLGVAGLAFSSIRSSPLLERWHTAVVIYILISIPIIGGLVVLWMAPYTWAASLLLVGSFASSSICIIWDALVRNAAEHTAQLPFSPDPRLPPRVPANVTVCALPWCLQSLIGIGLTMTGCHAQLTLGQTPGDPDSVCQLFQSPYDYFGTAVWGLSVALCVVTWYNVGIIFPRLFERTDDVWHIPGDDTYGSFAIHIALTPPLHDDRPTFWDHANSHSALTFWIAIIGSGVILVAGFAMWLIHGSFFQSLVTLLFFVLWDILGAVCSLIWFSMSHSPQTCIIHHHY
jgi:hypothetical protein